MKWLVVISLLLLSCRPQIESHDSQTKNIFVKSFKYLVRHGRKPLGFIFKNSDEAYVIARNLDNVDPKWVTAFKTVLHIKPKPILDLTKGSLDDLVEMVAKLALRSQYKVKSININFTGLYLQAMKSVGKTTATMEQLDVFYKLNHDPEFLPFIRKFLGLSVNFKPKAHHIKGRKFLESIKFLGKNSDSAIKSFSYKNSISHMAVPFSHTSSVFGNAYVVLGASAPVISFKYSNNLSKEEFQEVVEYHSVFLPQRLQVYVDEILELNRVSLDEQAWVFALENIKPEDLMDMVNFMGSLES